MSERHAVYARVRTILRTVLVVAAVACVQSGLQDSRDSSAADAAMANARAAAYSANGSLTVTESGYGPLAIGMTIRDAAVAIAAQPPSLTDSDSACAYISLSTIPSGVRVMVVHDTVVRVEVDSAPVATGLGAGIGDSEMRVRDLYGSRVSVQPHKYAPKGHYMIVSPIPPTDSGLRLVFETDGERVTRYRAGRLPEVMWVEGCG